MNINKNNIETATPAQIDEQWQEALRPAQQAEQLYTSTISRARGYERQGGRWAQEEFDDAAMAYAVLQDELASLDPMYDAEWDRRGGWSRYWLVSGGHLHHYNCHTIRPGQTFVGLLVEASGLTDAEVVAKYDCVACTKCFPDAPVARQDDPAATGHCIGSGNGPDDYTESAATFWNSRMGYRDHYVHCHHCSGLVKRNRNGGMIKHKAD